MTNDTREYVAGRLERLLAEGRLPQRAVQPATRLKEQLTSPVRISLLGPKGGGKSTLANVLAGAELIPPDLALPSLEIGFADASGLAVTLADGSRRGFGSLDLAAALALSPVFMELRAPLANLKQFSLLEAVTDGSEAELLAAAKWAGRRSDLTVWVTPEFDAHQRRIWQALPLPMRENGFLALNRSGPSAGGTGQESQIEKQAAAADFLAACPLDAHGGLQAIQLAGTAGEKALHAFGCSSLIAALTRRANSGRQADLDSALMFLKRYDSDARGQHGRPESSVQAPTGEDASDCLSLESTLFTAPVGQAESGLDAALAHIQATAAQLLQDLDDSDDVPADHILDRCVETIDDLTDLLAEEPLADRVMQAADIVVLLQLEKSGNAACEAVIALLQLRRDMETAFAA